VGRLGGIYALEGVMNNSTQYHRPVLEALCAFVREGTQHETGANLTGANLSDAVLIRANLNGAPT
jgi:uncharacterized protein YjbI with pentapeptide repeats